MLIELSCLAAIRATMGRSRELSTEAEYLAWVDLEGRLRGANHLAYPPVIAAGKGLVESMFGVEAVYLLLMDVGTEYGTTDTLGTAGMILLSCAGNNANTIHYIESLGGVEAWTPADRWGDRIALILKELLE
jgi:hypothetical protein